MKRDWLLPHGFRALGWGLLIPSLIVGIMLAYSDLIEQEFFGITLSGGYWDESVSTLIIAGLLMVGFSREKVEDEMTRQVRLESLQ